MEFKCLGFRLPNICAPFGAMHLYCSFFFSTAVYIWAPCLGNPRLTGLGVGVSRHRGIVGVSKNWCYLVGGPYNGGSIIWRLERRTLMVGNFNLRVRICDSGLRV